MQMFRLRFKMCVCKPKHNAQTIGQKRYRIAKSVGDMLLKKI